MYSINGEWLSSAYFSLGPMSQRLSVYYSDIAIVGAFPLLLDHELTMKRTVPEPCSGAGYVVTPDIEQAYMLYTPMNHVCI